MDLETLAEQLGEALRERAMMLAVAESCTGGWVAQALTSVAGSSRWFDRGFVTYSNTAKQEMLGVSPATLGHHGAVSEATAREMAEGALSHSHAHMTVAITGIAGPGGGSLEKPVGTVWLAWSALGRPTRTRLEHFRGDRASVRHQAVAVALQGLLDLVADGG